MTHRYKFGKIDATGNGRKDNAVEILVVLRERDFCTKQIGETDDKYEEFSVCGYAYNNLHTDFVQAGQCLDSLYEKSKELRENPAFKQIYELWKKYHCNGLNAGTVKQEQALDEAVKEGKLSSKDAHNYNACCDYLESIGLLEDKDCLVEKNGEAVPYKYGTGWLARKIPEEDLIKCREAANGDLESINKSAKTRETIYKE